MLLFGKYTGNPFIRISCTDYLDLKPFIERETSQYLKSSIIQSFQSKWSFHVVIKGERGSGKTSNLLYIGKIIRDQHSPKLIDDYIRGVEDVFKSPFHLFKHMIERLNIPFVDEIPSTMSGFQNKLKDLLEDKKYYFLIDVPDTLTKKYLDDFLTTIEYLIGIQNISIIIAMNMSHWEKSFSYSEVLGKFHQVHINLFDVEDTVELVKRRLKTVCVTDSQVKNNGIYPFTKDSLKSVQKISGGIPRLILTKCQKLFTTAHKENVPEIDYMFTTHLIEESHVEDTLTQRVADSTMRESLMKVYNVLADDLDGKSNSQKEYVNAVIEKGLYNNHITIRKKIKKLEKLHLITSRTSEDNMKSIEYKCVVPSSK